MFNNRLTYPLELDEKLELCNQFKKSLIVKVMFGKVNISIDNSFYCFRNKIRLHF